MVSACPCRSNQPQAEAMLSVLSPGVTPHVTDPHTVEANTSSHHGARAPSTPSKLDHITLLVLVRQVHLDGHPRTTRIVAQLQSMTVRDRPTALPTGTEGHDRRVVVVLQLDN